MRVSDYIFNYISQKTGVRDVFMLPGGGCMYLVDSLGKNKDLNYVCMLHEQAAAIAAEAYAQNRNDLGVALVTAGPGSTNAITGVVGAWIDSTPLLILSGQAKTEDLMTNRGVRQMGIQEVDIASIVSPIVKYVKCVTDPKSIPYELSKAVHLALSGRRGPVWLDIPLDVQGADIEPDRLPIYIPESNDRINYSDAAKQIIQELKKSSRPAVYVGNGVRSANAIPEFIEMVEKLQIPVLTSWKAADYLPENHPLYVGRPGMVGQRGANFVLQTCDCLLILGTRLDLSQTGFNAPHFAFNARKIMVDIDRAEIEKLDIDFTLSFPLDSGEVIRAILKENIEKLNSQAFLEKGKNWQARYPVILPDYLDENRSKVNLYHLIEVFSKLLGKGDLLIPGSSGACAEVTMQAIKVREGLRIHNTPGLGSMGFGLPAAIGGCIASGFKRTIGIIGDGGLQHNIQELETLRRLNLPIKMFVLNNNGYGSIYNMQMGRFDGHLVACNPDSGLTVPDLERIAYAYHLTFCRIEKPFSLEQQVEKALETPGTVLCEVMIDPSVLTSPRLASKALSDGRMESQPLENLAPFLSEEEFLNNMIIPPSED